MPFNPQNGGGFGENYITKRGNLTSTTSYADTSDPSVPDNPVTETLTYDMVGNVIASKACCVLSVSHKLRLTTVLNWLLLTLIIASALTCRLSHRDESKVNNSSVKPKEGRTAVEAATQVGPVRAITRIVLADATTAWVLNYQGELLVTRDAGNAWTRIGGDVTQGFNAFTMLDQTRGWAADSEAKIWRTEDGGYSWSSLSTLERDDPAEHYMMASQIVFIDSLKGWVIDPFAVWTTTDGGKSWREVKELSYRALKQQVRQINFLNTSLGWATADAGMVFQTNDGGNLWRPLVTDLPFNIGTDIKALQFITSDLGWLAATDPSEPFPDRVVVFTEDGGRMWKREKEIGATISINKIFFLDDEIGWMAGGEEKADSEDEQGVLFKSVDSGKSWHRIVTAPRSDEIKSVYFSSSEKGWVTTDYSVFRTDNGGKTWLTVLAYPEVRKKNIDKLGVP